MECMKDDRGQVVDRVDGEMESQTDRILRLVEALVDEHKDDSAHIDALKYRGPNELPNL